MKKSELAKLLVSGRTLVMAHRGDQSVAPENTLPAMENAAREEVDFIESDVRMTKDKKLVLFHDEFLERTCGKPGRIYDYNLAELKQIDLGEKFSPGNNGKFPFRGKGLTVMTVEEALFTFPDKYFNLDIKDEDVFVPKELGRIIIKHGMSHKVIVASFIPEQLISFRKLYPEILTSAFKNEVKLFIIGIRTGLLPLFMLLKKNNFSAFQVPETSDGTVIISEKFIAAAHKYGIAVHVWTVNEKIDMLRLIKLGVDGIFTDYPDKLIEVIKNYKQSF